MTVQLRILSAFNKKLYMEINYDYIYNRAYNQCEEIKYIPNNLIIGFIHYILESVPLSQRVNPIPSEWIDAIEDALHDSFYGGCEPEFDDIKSYESYIHIVQQMRNVEWHIDKEDAPRYMQHSPYKDKTVPYIRLKNN